MKVRAVANLCSRRSFRRF